MLEVAMCSHMKSMLAGCALTLLAQLQLRQDKMSKFPFCFCLLSLGDFWQQNMATTSLCNVEKSPLYPRYAFNLGKNVYWKSNVSIDI